MNKIISLLFILMMCSSALALKWNDSFESGLSKAKASGSPILIYFFNDSDEKSALFQAVIDDGRLNFLEENFTFVSIDVADPDNIGIVQKYNIKQIPFFALQDFDPKRSDKLDDAIGFEAVNIFKALYEIYSNLSTGFSSAGDYDTAYSSLQLLEDLPENMGVEVKGAMKKLEPKLKKKKIPNQNKESIFKAETYMNTAESNLKVSNYNKAYLYFSKVIELVPGSDLAKKAETQKNKIKDLVDKSVILNKTEKK